MSMLSAINKKPTEIVFDDSEIKRYRSNKNLKAAGQKIPWTNDMLMEYARCSEDIYYFIENYLKILHVDKGRIPFRMWDYQKEMLDAIINNRFNVITAARQVGKCQKLNSSVRLRNKKTGEIVETTIGEFYEKLKMCDLPDSDNKYTQKLDDFQKINLSTVSFSSNFKLSDTVERKITSSAYTSEWEIETDTGWEDVSAVHLTVPYRVWKIVTESGKFIECADTHVLFDENFEEIFAKDLVPNSTRIITKDGSELVAAVIVSDEVIEMADVEVVSDNHRFFSNGILSHNTSVAAAFLLWVVLFQSDKNIGILANKEDLAQEIVTRIQAMYELLPIWLQQGVTAWNKDRAFSLDNGSCIISSAASKSAVRGFSFSIVLVDEVAFIAPNSWAEFYKSVYPTLSSGTETRLICVSCVPKDTMVLTDRGPCYVEDFVNEYEVGGYYVPDYNIRGFGDFREGNIFFNNGTKDVYKVRSKCFEVSGTGNHKLLVASNGVYGWKEIKDIVPGDFICGEYGHEIFGDDDDISAFFSECKQRPTNNDKFFTGFLSEDMCYLLGLYIAEGSMGKHSVTITCGDDVSDCITRLGLRFSCTDGLHYRICSTKLVEFMKFLGFRRTTAKHKEIPHRLLRMSKKNIAAMLRGYFDGDGCATNEKDGGHVFATSISEKLIDQIRFLLQNFGILTTKRSHDPKPDKREEWKDTPFQRAYILGVIYQHTAVFYDKIGFGFERKQSRGVHVTENTRNGNNQDLIPFSAPILKPHIRYKTNKFFAGCKKRHLHFSREKILSLTDNLIDILGADVYENILGQYVKENLYWDKVKDVSYVGEKDTFDFSLPDTNDKWCHSVLYNGVVGHQTPNSLNHFYSMVESAKRGQSSFHYTEVPWWRVPGRDEAWKELQIRNTSEEDFRQEHCCEFIGSSKTLIPGSTLKMIGSTLEPYVAKNEDVMYWKRPEKDHQYLITCDTARGLSLDYSVFVVFDISSEPFEIVAIYRDNTVDPMVFPGFIANIGRAYNDAWVLCELNDAGEHVASNLRYEHEYGYMLGTVKKKQFMTLTTSSSKTVKKGLVTTKRTKNQGCTAMRNLIERNALKIVQEPLFVELCNFVRQDNGSFSAEEGAHDDIVMCVSMFAWCTTQEVFKGLIDKNVRKSLLDQNREQFGDYLPIGFSGDDEADNINFFSENGYVWTTVGNSEVAWDKLFGD